MLTCSSNGKFLTLIGHALVIIFGNSQTLRPVWYTWTRVWDRSKDPSVLSSALVSKKHKKDLREKSRYQKNKRITKTTTTLTTILNQKLTLLCNLSIGGRESNSSQVSSQQTLVLIYLPRKDGKLSWLRRERRSQKRSNLEPGSNWGPCGRNAEILPTTPAQLRNRSNIIQIG